MVLRKRSFKKKRRVVIVLPKNKIFRKVIYNYKLKLQPKFKSNSNVALVSNEFGLLYRKEVEFYRFMLRRAFKKSRIRAYVSSALDLPFTKKAKQSRMGKGKGKIRSGFCRVDKFDTVFEFKFNLFRRKVMKRRKKRYNRYGSVFGNVLNVEENKSNFFSDMSYSYDHLGFKLKRGGKRRRRRRRFNLSRKARLYFKRMKKDKKVLFLLYLNFLSGMDFDVYRNDFSSIIENKFVSSIRKYGNLVRSGCSRKNRSYTLGRKMLFLVDLIKFVTKYRFSLSLITFPFEYNKLYGRYKNSSIGCR